MGSVLNTTSDTMLANPMIQQPSSASSFSVQAASAMTSSALSHFAQSFTGSNSVTGTGTLRQTGTSTYAGGSAASSGSSSAAVQTANGLPKSDAFCRCASCDGHVGTLTGSAESTGSGTPCVKSVVSRSNTELLEIAATPTRILRGASAAVVAAVRTQSSPSLGSSAGDGTTGNDGSSTPSSGKPIRKLPVALRHGDSVFFVMCPEEEPKIAAELEDVQAQSRVVIKETLPRAVYRKLTDEQIGWAPNEPYKRPEHYTHHSGEMLHEDLDSYVGYDMDSEDEEWLDNLNARLKPVLERQRIQQQQKSSNNADDGGSNNNSGSSAGMATTLSKDDFELIIDRLEKVAFRRDQNKHSTMRQIAIDEGTEGCAICGDGMSEDANQMIYCDGCDMAVHQECYGVQYIPEGSWKCSRCLSTVPVKCCLCHERNPSHAIKQCVGGEWVHVICALWVPETTLRFIQGPGEIEYLDTIDVSTIPPERMQHVCSVCHVPGGACIKCCQDGCTNYFHPICAWQNHFHMKCTVPDTSSQLTDLLVPAMEKTKYITIPPAPCSMGVYKVWCPQHRPILKGVPQKGNKKQNKTGSSPPPSSSTGTTPPVESSSVIVKEENNTDTTKKKRKKKDDTDTGDSQETDSKGKGKRKGKKGLDPNDPTVLQEKAEALKKAAAQAEANVYAGVKLSRVLVKMRNIDPKFVEAVHEYWIQKRIKRGHIPLMKEFDPSILMLSHPVIKRHPKATNDKAGYKKLRRLRYDMERTRNILEVIRQRECAKLSLVENAQQQFDVNVKAARRLACLLRRTKQSPSPTADDERNIPLELMSPLPSPSPRLSLSSQPCSDSEDISPSSVSDRKLLPLSQLTTVITTQSDVEADSSFSEMEDDAPTDNRVQTTYDGDKDRVDDSGYSQSLEEEPSKKSSTSKKKQMKGVKRPADQSAPFLRLYFESHEDGSSRTKTKSSSKFSSHKQPQKCVIEVNPALRTEIEDDFVPPPRGESWVIGTSNHSSALPVSTKRLSAKQRATCEKQSASSKIVTVVFPLNAGAVPQTGSLPQPLVVKPTNKHILLSIVDRLQKIKHPT